MKHLVLIAAAIIVLSNISAKAAKIKKVSFKSHEQILIGIMTMIAFNPVAAEAVSKDEAAIKTIIESVAVLADSGNFDALEKLYADQVRVDYTSLVGGEVELKSPQTLMTQWASVLPGFDRTRHDISNISVTVNGANAVAAADVTADHFINDLYWQVKGDYHYELHKEYGDWRITSHTFNLKEETGTRDVFGPASEKAAASPACYILRRKTQQAVRDFLTALEDKNMEKFATIWTDDAVQEMPFSPKGFPKRVAGKANLLKHYAAWPEISGKSDFTSHLLFYPMMDPEMVFAEWKGTFKVIPTGRQYNQTYGGLFHVENGKISLFREYYDPAPFVYAFGLEEGESVGTLKAPLKP
jgi:ketosteroid isomerase-like protein